MQIFVIVAIILTTTLVHAELHSMVGIISNNSAIIGIILSIHVCERNASNQKPLDYCDGFQNSVDYCFP